MLREKGRMLHAGTAVNATLMAALTSTKNASGKFRRKRHLKAA